ncbi:hypothetical protein SAMN05444156_0546 [Verrucomicrobium sp. GAS474]|uniref:lysylphosphatidylglycerol synthase transmembrane domain-containing protein n=1 Tax=Verrucomicrobium sp. GAS474 TaxID=1882831 RepID=UPI000879FEAC|nr:lysylphosphatidylglycerol synthase transmembrane domain-containing protein [Verrucomicrobium sp. GAS474]SDT89831.1 hypothetical protein SAMN05444156_0546 [Verrucomicrobium sp. GAS474]
MDSALLRQRLGLAVRLLISGGILAYLAFKINWADLGSRIAGADPLWLLLGFVLMGVAIFLTAWRWKILLRVQDIAPGMRRVLDLTMIGQFFNAFLLGTTGGDVVKIFYITQAAPNRKSGAGFSVLADRIIGLIALVALTLALTLTHRAYLLQNHAAKKAVLTFYLIAAAIAGLFVVARAFPWLMRFSNFSAWEKKVPFHDKVEKLSEALRKNIKSPRANVETLLISFLSHGLNLYAQYCVFQALHLAVPLLLAITVTGLVYVLIAIPVTIAGLGVREGLFILFLGLAPCLIPREGAIAASVLGWSLTLGWSLVGGIFHLRYRTPDHSVLKDAKEAQAAAQAEETAAP